MRFANFPLYLLLLAGFYFNENRGHFNKFVVLYAALVIGLQIWAWRRESSDALSKPLSVGDSETNAMLAGGLCFFTLLNAIRPQVIYAEMVPAYFLFRAVNVALALLCFDLFRKIRVQGSAFPETRFRNFVSWALGLGALAQILVIPSSPNPFIDVYRSNTAAVDYLFQGLNPYLQNYPDIYKGGYDYKPGFLYFPGTLYWLAPFRFFFGDIRFSFVFANFIALAALWKLGELRQVSFRRRCLFVLIWMNFPVTYFVIEQAWTDPSLIALGFWTFWAVERSRILSAGALMGGLFALKQYAFVISWVGWLRVLRNRGWKKACVAAGVALLVIFICMAPFVYWDWTSLFFSTVKNQSDPAPRMDALSMTAFWGRIVGWVPPAKFTSGMGVFGIGLGSIMALSPKGRSLSASFLALFVAYGFAFIWGKWAFCNYHYLHASFLIAYILTR